MNLYPEQLRALAIMCEGLNKIDEELTSIASIPEVVPQFAIGIWVELDGTPFGKLVDEVGGAWSFTQEVAQ